MDCARKIVLSHNGLQLSHSNKVNLFDKIVVKKIIVTELSNVFVIVSSQIL